MKGYVIDEIALASVVKAAGWAMSEIKCATIYLFLATKIHRLIIVCSFEKGDSYV